MICRSRNGGMKTPATTKEMARSARHLNPGRLSRERIFFPLDFAYPHDINASQTQRVLDPVSIKLNGGCAASRGCESGVEETSGCAKPRHHDSAKGDSIATAAAGQDSIPKHQHESLVRSISAKSQCACYDQQPSAARIWKRSVTIDESNQTVRL